MNNQGPRASGRQSWDSYVHLAVPPNADFSLSSFTVEAASRQERGVGRLCLEFQSLGVLGAQTGPSVLD